MSGFLTPLEELAPEAEDILPSTEAIENGLGEAEQLVLNPRGAWDDLTGRNTDDTPPSNGNGGSPASKMLSKFFGTDSSFLGKLVAGLILGLIGLIFIFTALSQKTAKTVVSIGKTALESGVVE